MVKRFAVGFFVDRKGNIPVRDYLFDGTNEKDISVLINVIQRLAFIGQAILDTNMADHIEGPIYELRKDRHRILYAQDGERFVLFSAFIKKTQKTPPEEIRRAQRYYQEYLETGKFYEIQFP